MKKDVLHKVWKLKKIRLSDTVTSEGDLIEVFSPGSHNPGFGPDFLNANIKIASQFCVGDVAIHVKSSDWHLQGCEKDLQYARVILHVVWEQDTQILRSDGSTLSTLILSTCIARPLFQGYPNIRGHHKPFIYCEEYISHINDHIMKSWLKQLYFERLEEKSKFIFQALETSKQDWEAVLFGLLMRNFGLKVNGASFYNIAQAVDYSIVRKISADPLQLEALFFGLAGYLEQAFTAAYPLRLKKEYTYLRHKFKLPDPAIRPKFSNLRPANFPTIRLSQIARLYSSHQHLFSKVVTSTQIQAFYKLFDVTASDYWQTHYTWEKVSTKRKKQLSKSFIHLIIINSILPLKFCYAIKMGKDARSEIQNIVSALACEDNHIIKKYKALQLQVPSAMESQALLQLHHAYCSKDKCSKCTLGRALINT